MAYAGLGRGDEAITEGTLALQLLPPEKDTQSGAYNLEGLALIYAQLGLGDLAVEVLDRLLSQPGPAGSVAAVRLDPRYDPIRAHEGFQGLLRRLGQN